jgi:hypothetical protein
MANEEKPKETKAQMAIYRASTARKVGLRPTGTVLTPNGDGTFTRTLSVSPVKAEFKNGMFILTPEYAAANGLTFEAFQKLLEGHRDYGKEIIKVEDPVAIKALLSQTHSSGPKIINGPISPEDRK